MGLWALVPPAFLPGWELEAASRLFSGAFTLYALETILFAMCTRLLSVERAEQPSHQRERLPV